MKIFIRSLRVGTIAAVIVGLFKQPDEHVRLLIAANGPHEVRVRSNLPVNADMPLHIQIQPLDVLIETPHARVRRGRLRPRRRW